MTKGGCFGLHMCWAHPPLTWVLHANILKRGLQLGFMHLPLKRGLCTIPSERGLHGDCVQSLRNGRCTEPPLKGSCMGVMHKFYRWELHGDCMKPLWKRGLAHSPIERGLHGDWAICKKKRRKENNFLGI